MAKICNNCACYEVCFMANPCRTEDCNIGWQPIVVRCKDCKHLKHGYQCYNPLGMTLNNDGNAYCIVDPDDDFCSCGERKEDGE